MAGLPHRYDTIEPAVYGENILRGLCTWYDCSVYFPLHLSCPLLTIPSLVLSLNFLLLWCVFSVCPGPSLSLCCTPPTLLRVFWKDTFKPFFFLFLSLLLCHFFSFVTHHNCSRTRSSSLHLASDSHLLSVFTATSGDYLFYLFFPSLYFLSLCLCLDVQISWFLSQSISISFVPTCCSGVYP